MGTTPQPVRYDSRSCFGIKWYATEAEADEVGAQVTASGATYNGGFFHGRSCGRDPSFDYVDSVFGPLYAVTV